MVSWNKSFNAALEIIGYSFVWWVVGIIIFFFGLTIMGNLLGILMAGKALPDSGSSNVLIGITVMAIGYIIGISGTLAAFMKVFTELIIKETDKSRANTILNQNEEELNILDDIEVKSNKADKLMKHLKDVKGQ